MKKLNILPISTLLSALLLVFSGCSDDFEASRQPDGFATRPYYLYANFGINSYWNASGGETTFSVTSCDVVKGTSYLTPWAFEGISSWFTLSPLSGKGSENDEEVKLTFSENTLANDRSAIFLLSSKAPEYPYSQAISFTQNGAEPYAEFEENSDSYYIPGKASSVMIRIKSNADWIVSCPESWVSLPVWEGSGSAILSFAIEENPYQWERSAKITLYCRGVSKYLYFVQLPPELTLDESSTLEFDCAASGKYVSINSEAAWSVSAPSWIEVEPGESEAGEHRVLISVSDNSSTQTREGVVSFKIGSYTASALKVVQKGYSLSLSPENLVFSASAEEREVALTSNTDWQILSMPEWLSLKTGSESGSKDATLTFAAQENPDSEIRTGTVEFFLPHVNYKQNYSVRQNGKYAKLDRSTLDFSHEASSQFVEVISNGAWSVSTDDSWISILSPAEGVGNGTIQIGVSENNGEKRTGSVQLKIGSTLMEKITIVQEDKYLRLPETSWNVSAKGGTLDVSVFSNSAITHTVTKGEEWCSIASVSVASDAEVTVHVKAEPNHTSEARMAEIQFSLSNGKVVVFTIEQKAPMLSLDRQSVAFFGKGGVSQPILITSDFDYKTECSDDWFRVEWTGDNLFTVVADENTEKNIRRGTITFTMKDLISGELSIELPVSQAYSGYTIEHGDFEPDSNWGEASSEEKVTIHIGGFSEDEEWNQQ